MCQLRAWRFTANRAGEAIFFVEVGTDVALKPWSWFEDFDGRGIFEDVKVFFGGLKFLFDEPGSA